LFNSKKIEEILALAYESQTEIRETNNRLARGNIRRLEDMVDNKKEFADIHARLDVAAKQQEYIVNTLALAISNQEQLLRNQSKYIPLPKRKRKKQLTNATGWTKVQPDEIITFMEMYDNGDSITEIASATKRGASTVSIYINKELEKRENETTKA